LPTASDLPADVADASEPTSSHDCGFVADADEAAVGYCNADSSTP
jgi:hypothetical protein